MKKVGQKSLEKLNTLGFFSLEDILNFYPIKITKITPLVDGELIDLNTYTLNALVLTKPILSFIGPKKNMLKFKVLFNDKELQVSIFNRPFYKNLINVGKIVTIKGKYNFKYNSLSVAQILIDPIIKPKYVKKYGSLKKNKVSFKVEAFEDLVEQILNSDYVIKPIIDQEILKKYKLVSKRDALLNVHDPKNDEDLKQALRYLKFEELYLYFLQIEMLLQNKVKRNKLKLPMSILNDHILNLGFDLTNKQKLALKDCISDLCSSVPSSRLIQGDVGCGKTIVALLIMAYAVYNKKQAFMIAPTSILANQHFKQCQELFPNFQILEVNSKTLTSNLIKKINNNEFDILIGTTSILSQSIILENLNVDVVIIDEQQRFGVKQRLKLEQKLPHICSYYMSATPIPRTLELSILGYIKTSIIDEYPKTRKEIWTKIINKDEESFGIINNELKKGNKIYVVVPRITDTNEIKSINLVHKFYEKNFSYANIGVLHSKLTTKEKEQIFLDFNNGLIDILIATTIIEVGVNNVDATVIVINDAQMYGISQLHQLRGRVGRKNKQSYAFLQYASYNKVEQNIQTKKRLECLMSSTNGFELANYDLKFRGGGSLISEKQSGDGNFKLVSLTNDYDKVIAKYAKIEAINALKSEKKSKVLKDVLEKLKNSDVTSLN